VGLARSVGFGLLIVTFLVMAFVANVGFWALNSVLDTDAFVATADRVAEDPAVRSYLADQIASRAVDLVVAQLGSIPPALRNQLALPAAANRPQVEAALAGAVETALADPRAQGIVDAAVRDVHRAITQRGAATEGAVSLQGDNIDLDLDRIVAIVDAQVDPDRPGLFGVPIPAGLGTIPILHAGALAAVVRAAELARTMRWLLPAMAVVVALLALLLARHRIAALAWIGVCLLVVGLVCLGAVTVAAPFAAAAVSPGPARSAIAASVGGFASSLAWQSAVVAGVGFILVCVGALWGRSARNERALSYA